MVSSDKKHEAFAELVTFLRRQKGWSQATFARETGLSPSLISKIESGRSDPTKIGADTDHVLRKALGHDRPWPIDSRDLRFAQARVPDMHPAAESIAWVAHEIAQTNTRALGPLLKLLYVLRDMERERTE